MYFIIWQYKVRAGYEEEFERNHGSVGDRVQFLSRGDGFLETQLLRDIEEPHKYLTVDRWASKHHWQVFHSRYSEEYQAINEKCGSLLESVVQVGTFERVPDFPAAPAIGSQQV